MCSVAVCVLLKGMWRAINIIITIITFITIVVDIEMQPPTKGD